MKQKRCYEENKCGFCGKVMDGARENFNQAILELCKGKHVCVVKIGPQK